MKAEGFTYRARQLWYAYRAAPSQQDLVEVRAILNPGEMRLFEGMQLSEQAHSLAVIRRLQAQDPLSQDLLVAALLHDVGKSLYPLSVWERVLIVLVGALSPGLLARWGAGEPRGWRRVFVVACQHPQWGAEMAASQGASPLAVELIRQHQNYLPADGVLSTDTLLGKLQAADGNS
jgi:hypothetical protein